MPREISAVEYAFVASQAAIAILMKVEKASDPEGPGGSSFTNEEIFETVLAPYRSLATLFPNEMGPFTSFVEGLSKAVASGNWDESKMKQAYRDLRRFSRKQLGLKIVNAPWQDK